MSRWATVEGGVTAAQGFLAAGVKARIKGDGLDLAVLCSERPASVAGTFTSNRVQAAPVRLCRERVAGGEARAVVVNTGTANACTGEQGAADAARTAEVAAAALGIEAAQVLVCSTGCIGVPLPMPRMEPGVRAAVEALSADGGAVAARAILTTDTCPKECAVELTVAGRTVRVGGMAKGAGMIEPHMATMLAFVTTDAAVAPPALQECLSAAVNESFNRISVDGDQSTNDTVLLLANGAAGGDGLSPAHADWPLLCQAVTYVCHELAVQIVADGEGATKFVTVKVDGAKDAPDARRAARAIANSLLVKTSWFGGDPNWGRVMDAVGYSGADVREDRVAIRYDDVVAVLNGQRNEAVALSELERVLAQPRFTLAVDLRVGDASDWLYTCDCSYEYVKINSEYTT